MTIPAARGTRGVIPGDHDGADSGWVNRRPADLVEATSLLVRAQSGEARAVLDEIRVLFADAQERHEHNRAQWLRFARFVALYELRIVGAADEVAREMIRLAEPYDDRVWSAIGHALQGMSLLMQDQFEGAYDALARSVVLLEELDTTTYEVGHAINAAALSLAKLDLYELSAAWWDRMRKVADELSDAMLQTLHAFNAVWLHLNWAFELQLVGDEEQAKEHYRLTIEAYDATPTGVEVVRNSAWPSEVAVHAWAARVMLGEGGALASDLRKNLAIIAPTQRYEAILIGHLAIARAHANDGDRVRALEETEIACAAGDTLPRLPVPAVRAYWEYAELLRQHDGTSPLAEAYAQLTAKLIRDRWEDRRARVQSFQERLAHERVRDELRRRAAAYLTDPLTGLGNRRLIEIKLPELLVEAATTGRYLSVAFVDIDDFKTINDEISHLVGDDLLRELAQEMRSAVSGDDVVARFGGEEFVLVLPGRTSNQAYLEMDELRARVERRVWRCLPPGRRVTITVGLTESWDRATRTQMLATADEALLSAKRSGKNRVEIRRHPLADATPSAS